MSCAAAEQQQPQRFVVENQVKRIVILLHRYLGLLAALFALLLGLSGSLLAVQQLLQGESDTAPVASHAASPHYQAVLASLRASYPQADFTLRLPQNPAAAIEVRIRQRQQPDQMVWLDPQHGQPLATPEGRGTGWRWLHELHARLLLEDGKTWVGVAGIAILLVLLSGIIHWWPRTGAKPGGCGATRAWWYGWATCTACWAPACCCCCCSARSAAWCWPSTSPSANG
jgi:uncharacterized iron-regulated membrane protein